MDYEALKTKLEAIEQAAVRTGQLIRHFEAGAETYGKNFNVTPYQSADVRAAIAYVKVTAADTLLKSVALHDAAKELDDKIKEPVIKSEGK